jgi:glucose-6-phosphate dehydrogenase assembly protein OpcA
MASTLREIESELAGLRAEAARDDIPEQRTSVATHIAWVPPEWAEKAREVMAGLGERHPSRVILLFPEPDAEDGLEAAPQLQCFPIPGSHRELCAEVIDIRLRGAKAHVPESIVRPLIISDLPVFLRWRGELPFGEPELDGLVEVADRLVVDGAEWRDPHATYAQLRGYFDRIAVSDIAWARTLPWRAALAELWPKVGEARELRVRGPYTDALLLVSWLRERLERAVELAHEQAEAIAAVAVDGTPVEIPRYEAPSTADMLSDQLEIDSRDRVYENAVRELTSRP